MGSIGLATLLLALSTPLICASSMPSRQLERQATITRLIARNYNLTISQGANGEFRYDLNSPDGQLLDFNLNEEQLQSKYPEIYDHLRPAYASDAESFDNMLLMLEAPEQLDPQ